MLLASIRAFIKTVAAPATPEALGAASIIFNDISFIAQKGFEVANTSDVFIQIQDNSGTWVDHRRLLPGQELNIIAPPGSAFRATDFRIRVLTANDGVRCEYSIS